MLRRLYNPVLRLALLSLLVGMIPPGVNAAVPSRAPDQATARVAPAPAATPPTTPARIPAASNPPPSPNVPPASTPAHAPIGQVTFGGLADLLIPPKHASDVNDKIWRYRNGLWMGITPPRAGWYWIWIEANKFDPNQWLLLGNTVDVVSQKMDVDASGYVKAQGTTSSPAFYSPDAGLTWFEIALHHPYASSYSVNQGSFSVADISQLHWSDVTPNTWMAVGFSDGIAPYLNRTYYWRGSASANGAMVTPPGALFDASQPQEAFGPSAAGLNDDLIFTTQFPHEPYLRYVPTSATAWTTPSGAALGPAQQVAVGLTLERAPGASAVVALTANGQVFASADYTAAQPTMRTLPGGLTGGAITAITTPTGDRWYLGERGDGIVQITNLTQTPSASVVPATSGDGIGFIRADRQTRTIVAARSNVSGSIYVSTDGTNWQSVPGPRNSLNQSVPLGNLADRLEVIGGRTPLDPAANRTGGECGCNAQYQKGPPVNTRTGNYWTQVLDLAVQTPGPALTWTRIYANQAITETTRALGYGWQSSYGTRLILPTMPGGETGRAIIFSGRANWLRFTLQNGQYVADPGITSSLVQAGSVYTQTLRDQQQLVFDGASGRLTTIYDSQGRKVILDYNTTFSPARLTLVHDANDASRALTVSYDGTGRINGVSDGGRSVSYGYDASDNLTSVTDVMLHPPTLYSYQTPANHLLTRITDPLGQATEQMTYDSATPARVSTQVLQDGRQLQFGYLSATTVVTTTGLGKQDVERFDYAADNTLAGITINGQAVQASAFDANHNPAVVSDGEAHTTQTSFNSVGLPTVQADALGQTTRVQYDLLHRPILVTDTLGIAMAYQYDQYNNMTRITAGITTTSTIRATTSYTFSYNVRYTGDSLLSKQQRPDGVVTRYDYPTSGSTTARGQVSSMTVGDGLGALAQTTTFGYDPQGRVMTTTVGFGTALARMDVTRYNADNTVQQTIQNYKNGVFDAHRPDEDISTTYGYDTAGRQIWVKDALGHYDVTHYNANGQADWSARNLTGYSGGALPATPPAYGPAQPDANIATFYGYDTLGRTVLVTQTGILTGTFNTATNPPQFTQATQRVTRTQYDTLSRPITVTLDYGGINAQSLTYYDGASNPIWQRDPLGRWTKTEYDTLNRPIKTIANDQDGSVAANEPSDQDLISVTSYDSAGRVAQQIENWVDGTFGATDTITDRLTLYQYDTLGRLQTTIGNATTRTGPDLNHLTKTVYNATTGLVIGQGIGQQPIGQAATLLRWSNQQYDALGRVVKTIQNCATTAGAPQDPSQQACAAYNGAFTDRNVPTLTAYDVLNRVTDGTDALNVVTRTQYDGLSRTSKTTRNYKDGNYNAANPDEDVSTAYQYDALGRTLAVTDTLSFATRSAVNSLGQTTQVTDQQGRVTLNGYDGSGTLRWTKRPDGQVMVSQVDGLGRIVAMIVNYQDGTVAANEPADRDLISQTRYDIAGRRTQSTDPAGHASVFDYDNLDRLIAVTENYVTGACAQLPCNIVTQYRYDRAGNRITIVDPLNHTRTFKYNAADEQKQALDPLGFTTVYTYDQLGRLTNQQDPRGSGYNLTFSYDGRDRLTQTAAGNPANLATITAGYDALGRRLSLADGSGATSFTYDALSRMLSANAPSTGNIGYSYDGRGARTKLVYPDSTTINYAYFTDGRLQQVTQGATNPVTLATYAYDAVGRPAQVVTKDSTTPTSQLVTNYGYDRADRLRALRTLAAGGVESRFQYQPDRLGLRTVVTETLPLNPTFSTARLKTITFEAASLTDLTSGADSVVGTVLLTNTTPLKEFYSAVIPNVGNAYLREDLSPASDLYLTFYLKLNALPPGTARIGMISNSGTTVGSVQLTSAGKLRLRNGSTTIGTDSAALTVGALYRVGLHQKQGSGTGILEAYLASGDQVFGSPFAASTTQTISTPADRVQIGATTATAANIAVDNIALDGSAFAPPSMALAANGTEPVGQPGATTTPTMVADSRAAPLAGDAALAPQTTGAAAAHRGNLPLAFVPNSGQTDAAARFVAHSMGGMLFFTADGMTMALPTPDPTGQDMASSRGRHHIPRTNQPLVVRMRFEGANATPALTSLGALPGKVNYLVGADPSMWRTNLSSYASLAYGQLYPGIELRYDGNDNQIASTYNVAPGADPTRIRWRYLGARDVAVDASGNLAINLPPPNTPITATNAVSGTVVAGAPRAWQVVNEVQVAIPVHYVIGSDGSVGFAFGAYDPTLPLTIDPILTYTTYLGNSGNDYGEDIAADRDGNAYVVGSTTSGTFLPTPLRPYQAGYDAWVAKLSADGTRYLYTTYLGGTGDDYGYGIAVDSADNAYITGGTRSGGTPPFAFPTTPGVVQGSPGGNGSCATQPCEDAFVTKLNATGSALLYSTYLGGINDDEGRGIAVDTSGKVYLTGTTSSNNFPSATGTPLQAAYGGGGDAFVAKLNATASQLDYRTYLGGSATESGEDIAVDGNGNAYVTGSTASGANFPTLNGLQSPGGGTDAFVVELNPTAGAEVYGTLIGGSGTDVGNGIAVDGAGNAYVTGTAGTTTIPNFTTGTNSGTSAFVAKLRLFSGHPIYDYNRYLGGSGSDVGNAIAVTATGNAYVTGDTTSADFPSVTSWPPYLAGTEAFMARLDIAGLTLAGANMYLSGSGTEHGKGIALDRAGNSYVTGDTNSTDFMSPGGGQVCPCPVQGYLGGLVDAFVVKVASDSGPVIPPDTRVITYSYDGLLRLTSAMENPGTAYTYAYDAAGNRTDVWQSGSLVEHRDYTAANQVSGWLYDAAGNLLNDGTNQYSYDALNRSLTVQRGGQSRTNTYNGDGVLVKQVAAYQTSTTTRYTQDLAAPLSQILQAQGSTTTDYLYGRERLASLSGSTRTWYLGDALGSVRRTVSDTGTPNASVNYDPWGTPETGTVPTFGFTGELQDANTGLVNLRARWYSTAHSTFTSRDPFAGVPEQPYSFNPYQYGYSDPVLNTDPSGRVVAVDGGSGGGDPNWPCPPGSYRDRSLERLIPGFKLPQCLMGPPPPNNEQPQPGSDSSRERTRALLGGVGLPDTGATNNADTGVARRGGNTGILVEAGLLACLWATLNALDRVGPTTWPRTRSQPSQKIVELGHDLTFDNLVSLAAAFPNAQVYGIEQSASAVQAGQNALPKLAPKFAPRITLIAADYTTYRDPSLNHQADLVVVVAPFPGTGGAVKQGVDNFVKPGGIVLILTEDDAMKNSFEVLFRTKATLRQPRSHTSILGDPYHYIVGTSIGVPMTSVHFQHGAWEIFVSASGGTMP